MQNDILIKFEVVMFFCRFSKEKNALSVSLFPLPITRKCCQNYWTKQPNSGQRVAQFIHDHWFLWHKQCPKVAQFAKIEGVRQLFGLQKQPNYSTKCSIITAYHSKCCLNCQTLHIGVCRNHWLRINGVISYHILVLNRLFILQHRGSLFVLGVVCLFMLG